MPKVTKTELNQQTARVLARVAAGERLTITDRGRPIAELTPAVSSAWDQLVAAGRVTLPSTSGALASPLAKSTASVSEILDQLRADRP
ncbi:MAG: type II toxin-antitoxin system Phd/YefM family antitoxin [Actinomycetota bacterium]